MLSIRALTRSIPRSFPRLSSPSLYRPVSTLRQPSLLQRPWTTTPASRLTAAFSTSRTRWEKQGEVDEELVAKFESELQMENEMRDSDEVPVSVKDYLETGPFEMQDTPGQEDVVLTRQFGDETIRVVFSIADLNHLDPDADRYEDRALADEEDEDDEDGGPIPDASAQSGGAQSKAAVNAGRTSGDNIAVTTEDSVAPADRPELSDDGPAARDEDMEEDDGEEQDPSFPARLTVTVTKPGQGALQIETVAQDGMIVIDNVHYFADPALATDESLPARKAAYAGPPFGNLDEDLQVLLERYLDERGVNTALALFVPDYIDFKEQREYLSWLSNVKSFVEA